MKRETRQSRVAGGMLTRRAILRIKKSKIYSIEEARREKRERKEREEELLRLLDEAQTAGRVEKETVTAKVSGERISDDYSESRT